MKNTAAHYTGAPNPWMPGWGMQSAPGCCRSCGQPSASCCCGCRECRREPKELLVTGTTGRDGNTDTTGLIVKFPIADGFIGGSCCVSVSVEYAPLSPTDTFSVRVAVKDSEGTTMSWSRTETAGTGYRIKEAIITTNPGAQLEVEATNCTARVRWCEVFSC